MRQKFDEFLFVGVDPAIAMARARDLIGMKRILNLSHVDESSARPKKPERQEQNLGGGKRRVTLSGDAATDALDRLAQTGDLGSMLNQ